jgi:site-specific recombinase XerD
MLKPHWSIDEFLYYYRASGRAPATIKGKRNGLHLLLRWAEQEQIEIENATAADLLRFVTSLLRYTPDHVNNVISSLRVYYAWLCEEQLRPDSPARRVKYLPAPPKPVESLSDKECELLVEWATRKAPKARFGVHRTAVMALLMLDTGLRVGEVTNLVLSDLDFENERIVVRKTKTKDFRVVPLSMGLRTQLRRYLMRRGKNYPDTDVLFLAEDGRPCSRACAERSFQNIHEACGIGRRVRPHLLRHTFATQILLNGAPMPAVMRIGGWRKLSTVQR